MPLASSAASSASTSKDACTPPSASGPTPSMCIERSGVTSPTTSSTACSSRPRKRRRAVRPTPRNRFGMRRLQPPQNEDPRIDLEQAQASTALGKFPDELAAAQQALRRAERGGSRHLVARARLFEGRSYFNQGQLRPAEESLQTARQIFVDIGDRAGSRRR